MTGYAALLRAVNVGGIKLLMSDLRDIGVACGFQDVATYIASGNLLLRSADDEASVKTALEAKLAEHMQRVVPVLVRSAQALSATLTANPFAELAGNRAFVIFLDRPATEDDLAVRHMTDERMTACGREVYVAFPNGMAQSKMVLGAMKTGTMRNVNTVRKLAELTAVLG